MSKQQSPKSKPPSRPTSTKVNTAKRATADNRPAENTTSDSPYLATENNTSVLDTIPEEPTAQQAQKLLERIASRLSMVCIL